MPKQATIRPTLLIRPKSASCSKRQSRPYKPIPLLTSYWRTLADASLTALSSPSRRCLPHRARFNHLFAQGIFMMKGQLAGLMRQAQQMQDNMKKAQEELADIVVQGASGGGLVTVDITCRNDVRRVSIDPELFEDDRAMVEDLAAAAVNDALRRAEAP